jgi:uncharacterized membrane protein YkvA (DUF1232 family)
MDNGKHDEYIQSTELGQDDAEKLKEKIIFGDDDRKLKFYEDLRRKVRQYSNDKAGNKAGKLTEYLLVLPDLFILVCRLAIDERVGKKKKIFVGAVIAYMIMPIDIIPDFFPIIGQLDDLVLVILALNTLLNDLDKQIVLDNWSGHGDILQLIQTVMAQAESFLDKNILQKIKSWINKKS